MVLTVEPLVAVTMTVEVPFGVPASGGGFLLPPPPPPPQAGTISSRNMSVSTIMPRVRFFPPTSITPNNPSPVSNSAGRNIRRWDRIIAVGAVVVIVIVAFVAFMVPFALRLAGENVHLASDGNPEHANEIVPLNPVEFETFTSEVPLPPGVVMVTVEAEEGIAA